MLKQSRTHFLQYDAATYDNEGFKTLHGRIGQLAQNPRYWSVTVRVTTENEDTTGRIVDSFTFKTAERCILSDLRERIKSEVLDKDDYAPVCVECLVTARVMTEGGV